MREDSFRNRLKHAYSVFRNGSTTNEFDIPSPHVDFVNYGYGSSTRIDRTRLNGSTERSMVSAMYTKIAVDVAAVPLKHARVDQNGRYLETINSGLNNCLSVEANLDQTGREFIFDAVFSMFDEGCVALVPVETTVNLKNANAFDINVLRTGRIVEWFPQGVKVEVYDQNDGKKKIIYQDKRKVAIVENPFYSVMNAPNSTLKRLISKLNLLDTSDKARDPSKLNMILQLPYVVKTEARKKETKKRIDELESQLAESQYGVAYIDGTERIHQINGSIDNNLYQEIERLTKQLYSQMGITESVFDGTADEKTMLNYQNSTIEPILAALANEMIRKFLTKTARTQNQTILYLQDPFRLVPVSEIAEIADKFTRNEITSANEIRSVVGMKPVDDERADELRNRNLNRDSLEEAPTAVDEEEEYYE